MAGQSARESAYAELVAGLVDARDDVATARFDAELARAEADGRVDAATARTLRWWQRASVRAVGDHARAALPPVLAALDRAHDVAVDDLAAAEQALDDAMAAAFPGTEPVTHGEPLPPGTTADVPEPTAEAEASGPDLSSRRLLVAGLTPLTPPQTPPLTPLPPP